ncbi:MAG TPA: aminotransferase class I/II-fold pyridoxal phosphate-dependent enzyme, partial [Chloroflexota bacterium]|nr:aminotransferase class I/II-fold pyridoxal phosphate-dependent enzyme [Chloroflexota bacterium]
MVGQRTAAMTPIGVERMGNAADALHDRTLLRLENLDTDLRPPTAALEATEAQVRDDDANSYLPFFGHERLRRAAVRLVERNGGLAPGHYDPARQCFISAGGLSGILNVLLALIEPGDEVVLTSPTYVGLINRVKLAGGVPRYIRMVPGPSGWRLDAGSLRTAVSPRTRAFLMMSPSMPSGAVFTRDEWQAVCDACIAA